MAQAIDDRLTLAYSDAIAHMVSWHAKSPFSRQSLTLKEHKAGILTPAAYIQDNSDWLIDMLIIYAFFPNIQDFAPFCKPLPRPGALTIDERYQLDAKGIAYTMQQALKQKVIIQIIDIQKNESGYLKFSQDLIHRIRLQLSASQCAQIDTWLSAKYQIEKRKILATPESLAAERKAITQSKRVASAVPQSPSPSFSASFMPHNTAFAYPTQSTAQPSPLNPGQACTHSGPWGPLTPNAPPGQHVIHLGLLCIPLLHQCIPTLLL